MCLGPPVHAVLTNCGHCFCAACFLAAQRHAGAPLAPLPCLLCRRPARVLMPAPGAPPPAARLAAAVAAYNARHSGAPRAWREHLRDAPGLARALAAYVASPRALALQLRLRLALLALLLLGYWALAFDLLPEALLGPLGLADDAVALLLGAGCAPEPRASLLRGDPSPSPQPVQQFWWLCKCSWVRLPPPAHAYSNPDRRGRRTVHFPASS